jgi:2-dehydropantoate 2-reductase
VKVVVVGGGAMGGLWAALLESTGTEVSVLDVMPAVVEAIRTSGLVVTTADREVEAHPTATVDPADLGPADVVFFFTKAHHTRAAASLARPVVGESTTVVSLQNGWGNSDVIAEAFGPERLVSGVTYHSARVSGPARISHTSQGSTVIGPFADNSDWGRTELVSTLQNSAGIETTTTRSVHTEIWKKVVLNSATLPTAALTGLYAGELGEPGRVLDLVDAIAVESVSILRAAGYDIDVDERVASINGLLARAGRGKPSMLQDVEARRKTEVEVINGAIVRVAERLGLDAPLNRAMVALIGGLERSWVRE